MSLASKYGAGVLVGANGVSVDPVTLARLAEPDELAENPARAILSRVIDAAIERGETPIEEVPAPHVLDSIREAHAGSEMPYNAVTGAQYQGKNIDRLASAELMHGYGPGGWAGFGQWLKVGRVVRKGEHGTACITVIGRSGTESETARSVTDSRETAGKGKRKGGGVRGFRVFHFDQTTELKSAE